MQRKLKRHWRFTTALLTLMSVVLNYSVYLKDPLTVLMKSFLYMQFWGACYFIWHAPQNAYTRNISPREGSLPVKIVIVYDTIFNCNLLL